MWTTLTAQHLERASDNQHDLLMRYYDYKYQPETDMKNHIANIKSIAHQLEEVGRPIEERELITKIISTLPIDYKAFVSSWRHVATGKQTLLTLTSLILQEEREITKWRPKSSDNKDSAFHAQNRDESQGYSNHYQKRNYTI